MDDSNGGDDSAIPGFQSNTFDPEVDLINRYERMVEQQIRTINDIDDKAAFVARLEALIITVALSAVSVAIEPDQLILTWGTLGTSLAFGLAMTSFSISIVFAMITYQKSRLLFGPTSRLGTFMSKYRVDDQDYKNNLLGGYSYAIRENWEVMVNNAQQFEKSLAALVFGIVLLFVSGILLILSVPFIIKMFVFFGSILMGALVSGKIMRHDFITLETSTFNHA